MALAAVRRSNIDGGRSVGGDGGRDVHEAVTISFLWANRHNHAHGRFLGQERKSCLNSPRPQRAKKSSLAVLDRPRRVKNHGHQWGREAAQTSEHAQYTAPTQEWINHPVCGFDAVRGDEHGVQRRPGAAWLADRAVARKQGLVAAAVVDELPELGVVDRATDALDLHAGDYGRGDRRPGAIPRGTSACGRHRHCGW